MNFDIDKKKTGKMVLITLFIMILIAPTADNTFGFTKKISLNENRTLASFPDIKTIIKSPIKYFTGFDKFYNDHFGFRKAFIKTAALVKFKIFNTIINPKVVIGEKNWLFMEQAVNCKTSTKKFTASQLNEWKNYLEGTYSWSKNNGITYMFVIAPDKKSIYSEFLPNGLKARNKDGMFRQLVNYMKSESEFKITDLRPPLLEAKKENQVYYKTDSHWNQLGAFVAVKTIADNLRITYPNIKKYNLSDYDISEIDMNDDSTQIFLENAIEDINWKLKGAKGKTTFNKIEKKGGGEKIVTENDDPTKPNILVIGDSFINNLHPFISEMGNKVIFYIRKTPFRKEISEDFIKKEKIDIIIQEMTEKYLWLKTIPKELNEDISSIGDD